MIFDVIIIGGGPGGYVAAIRAKQLGLSVALVESAQLGGICLNWGCIPTKSLLKSSQLFQMAHHLSAFGITVETIKAEITTMVQRSRKISAQLARGIQALLKHHGVVVYQGRGTLGELEGNARKVLVQTATSQDQPSPWSKPSSESSSEPCSLQPTHQNLLAHHVILATGARPRKLPLESALDLDLWSSKEAMLPEHIPASLLIVGAGAIGIEFASFYQSIGTKVTVVEQQGRILPTEDEEISTLAGKLFTEQGILFHNSCSVERIEQVGKEKRVHLRNLETHKESLWQGEQVLVAIGVVGNTENLGLEHTQVKIHQGHIVTYGLGKSDEPGIYAIGDVAGPPWLAHKASHEGVLSVEGIAGLNPHAINPQLIPGCVYSSPQLASIGLTEGQALKEGHPIKIGRFPFAANGAAMTQGEKQGLIKVIFHRDTGELLGAHMIGQGVSELIQGFAIAKTLEATEEDLKRVIFPHPSLSEMMHEAVLDADGLSLHTLTKV